MAEGGVVPWGTGLSPAPLRLCSALPSWGTVICTVLVGHCAFALPFGALRSGLCVLCTARPTYFYGLFSISNKSKQYLLRKNQMLAKTDFPSFRKSRNRVFLSRSCFPGLQEKAEQNSRDVLAIRCFLFYFIFVALQAIYACVEYSIVGINIHPCYRANHVFAGTLQQQTHGRGIAVLLLSALVRRHLVPSDHPSLSCCGLLSVAQGQVQVGAQPPPAT